jgi:hypothetical protein
MVPCGGVFLVMDSIHSAASSTCTICLILDGATFVSSAATLRKDGPR